MSLSNIKETEILHVDYANLKGPPQRQFSSPSLEGWTLQLPTGSKDAEHIQRAAYELQTTDTPVAFPTETVYGLGADATRSAAVRGIFRAKQRPSDNPLIVHFHSLEQLREVLRPNHRAATDIQDRAKTDPIPAIYLPLIKRFWPGPLTLIMPNPQTSPLAPEVTAGLPTFGARMPGNVLALALIKQANVPLAAPSANASTRPSPTSAQHVFADLQGRIKTILDGGPCEVGVESTVVDGLTYPPVVLRPGCVSIEDLRSCPGWEAVEKAYKDVAQTDTAPRAPGMKYKHYSPKSPVHLYEHGVSMPSPEKVAGLVGCSKAIGIIRTASWPPALGFADSTDSGSNGLVRVDTDEVTHTYLSSQHPATFLRKSETLLVQIYDISLGSCGISVANGLFSAMRELDAKNVDCILVEGMDDSHGDVASAVMNRLRKAAEFKIFTHDS